MQKTIYTILLIIICLLSLPLSAAPIRVMLLDGESGGPYHKWQMTTPVLKKQLEETGLFQVDVVTAPPAKADFSGFKPEFSKYQVVVMNYDAPDERWSDELKSSFEQYVKNGGGLVIVHAANNAFGKWKEYNEMIGIGGWRGRNQDSNSHLQARGFRQKMILGLTRSKGARKYCKGNRYRRPPMRCVKGECFDGEGLDQEAAASGFRRDP